MLKHVESKIFVLPFLLVIACAFLTGCPSSKKIAEETDEKLLLNEHVNLATILGKFELVTRKPVKGA